MQIKHIMMKLFSIKKWAIAFRKKDNPNDCIYDRIETDDLIIFDDLPFYSSADPFLYSNGNKTYIFYERFNHLTEKGKIVCKLLPELGSDDKTNSSKKILEEKWHLSYPCIFLFKGGLYMIPESRKNNSIRLYECINFPYKWQYKHTILNDISAVDTTFFQLDNNNYIFTYVNNDLCLYRLDDTLNNPEQINNKFNTGYGVRPAGNIISKANLILRPAQDCKEAYGQNIILYSLEVIRDIFGNRSIYSEKLYKIINHNSIRIERKIIGIHTYNSNEDYEVIDIKYEYKSLIVLFIKIISRLINLLENRSE